MADFTPRVLRTAHGSLTAYDHGAQVGRWVQDGVPVTYLSERSRFAGDAAIRGGVPLCWPWFAAGPQGDRSPSHGFLRLTRWHQVPAEEGLLRWQLSEQDVRGRPGAGTLADTPFRAQVEVGLDEDSLQVSLSVRNTGGQPLDYEVALHTYLQVGDVQAVVVHGLEGVGYWDKVASAPATQEGPLVLTGETDRIYESAGPVRVHDPVLGRDLELSSTGASRTVVWNPWEAGCAELSDMAPQDWRRMVCVEAAAIGAAGVRLEPGGSHTLAQRIRVRGSAAPPPR